MKKFNIFCSILLAAGLVACDDKSDLGIPQVNEQEAIMSAGGLTVGYGSAIAGDALDLNAYKEEGKVPVISFDDPENLPEGGKVALDMYLATNDEYSDAVVLPVVDGSVDCNEWDTYFRSKFGKSPAAKDMFVKFAAYVELGAQKSRIGTPDTWFAAKKLNVTPVPMDFVLEEAYNMIGTINGWSLSDSNPFKHSAANVYDDPNFTISVEITDAQAADGWWWKIAPASAVNEQNWDKCLGVEVDGSGDLEGKLFENGKAGCIKEAGSYLITINVLDMTYSFEKMSYLYTPGNSNGWNQGASQMLKFDNGVFKGFAYLDGGFKFTNQPDWNGTNYGDGGDGVLSTDGGAGNLNAPEAGLYYCEVNVDELTYTITKVNSWGMIGGFNSWGGDEALTPSDNFLVWNGTLTLGDASEWKFRANGGWDINLGGAESNLWFGGDNLKANAGTYNVTLDLRQLPYSCSVVKK